jgi:hypothetical protein
MKVKDIVMDVMARVGDPEGKRYHPEMIRRTINRVYEHTNRRNRCLSLNKSYSSADNPVHVPLEFTLSISKALSSPSLNRSVMVTYDGAVAVSQSYGGANGLSLWLSDLTDFLNTLPAEVTVEDTEIDYVRRVRFSDFPFIQHSIFFEETISDSLSGLSMAGYSLVSDYILADYFALPDDYVSLYYMEPQYHFIQPIAFRKQRGYFTIDNNRLYIAGCDAEGFEIDIKMWRSGKELVEVVSDSDTQSDEPEWPSLHQLLYYGACVETTTQYDGYQMDYAKYIELLRELSLSVKDTQMSIPDISPDIQNRNVKQKTRYGDDPYYLTKPGV